MLLPVHGFIIYLKRPKLRSAHKSLLRFPCGSQKETFTRGVTRSSVSARETLRTASRFIPGNEDGKKRRKSD